MRRFSLQLMPVVRRPTDVETRKPNLEARLKQIAFGTPWLMRALNAVREVSIPEAYIGSGAIRNAVWDALHGYKEPSFLADIDVPYFDTDDLSEDSEKRYEERLARLEPDPPWDVKNQAAVHLWFHKVFGHPVEQITSMEDAVSTWPERCVCVAVRIDLNDDLQIIAPFGLDDLFGMKVRRNPRRVSLETYDHRLRTKRYDERWPLVQVLRA